MVESDLRGAQVSAAAARRSLLLPALIAALPLAAAWWLAPGAGARAAQEGGAREDDGAGEGVAEEARIVGARPLVPLASESSVGSVARPRQSPFLVVRGGQVLLLNLVWEPAGGDRIEVREVEAPGSGGAARPVRLVAEAPAEIVAPVAAVDGEGRLWVAWTGLVGDRAQLFATREEGDAFLPPRALTAGREPNLLPALARAADGRIWVAWEGEEPVGGSASRRRAFVAPLQDDVSLGSTVAVDAPEPGSAADRLAARDVAIAAAEDALWVAWSQWRRDDDEIVARRLDPATGALGPTIVVSDDPRGDDRHPAVAVAPDGTPWIAWDRTEIAARGESGPRRASVRQHDGTISVQVRVACIAATGIERPRASVAGLPDGMVDGAPALTTGGGAPQIAFDGAGRLWVAYRYLEAREGQRKFGFPVLLQHLSADGFSAPLAAAESVGNAEAVALAPLPDGGVLAAFARDERASLTARERKDPSDKLIAPLRARNLEHSRWNGLDSIGLARARVEGDSTSRERVPSPPRPTPPERVAPNDLDDPFVNGAARFVVERGEERYFAWFGDLHRHSNLSRCSVGLEPGPSDRYVEARDLHRCDFFALTDHSGALAPADGWLIDKLNWLHDSSRFVTLTGFEWSTQEHGHHNVILPERLSLLVSPDQSLASLYKNARRAGALTIPHHPADRAFPNDWADVDDRSTRLLELYQACRGNYEFDGCFRQAGTAAALGTFVHDALRQGCEFGLIASTDHSYGQSYAVALAPELSRSAIFDALMARRTYGATAKGLFVDLRVGGALMGETIERFGALPIRLKVRGTRDLVDVVLFRDGKVLQSLRDPAAAPTIGNTLAPLRLVARFPPNRGPAADDWKLALDCREGTFTTVVPAPAPVRRRNIPRPEWNARNDHAELLVPAGFESGRHPAFVVHLVARGEAELRLRAGGDAAVTTSVSALLAAPRRFGVPGLVDVELSIEAGDAEIDLARTLGTKELEREWEDATPREGPAWYYARIIQADGEMAWSSPVFVRSPP
jgi:hypothetical protein